MVQMCYDANNWDVLNETITMLSKRRAQLKQVVGAMVRLATTFVDEQKDEALKLQLIHTLRAVSEGKIFVEVERARLTKTLATITEAKGEIEEARKIMQDTQVETLGGMDKREKTEFILEQIRLCLAVHSNHAHRRRRVRELSRDGCELRLECLALRAPWDVEVE